MKRKKNHHEGKSSKVINDEDDTNDEGGQFEVRTNIGQHKDYLDVHDNSNDREGQYKPKIIAIISFTNTDTDPRTVVIETFDTSVAH